MEQEERAREIALRQLAMGPRTKMQLETALLKRDVPADVARAIVDRYEEVHLIDDVAYATMWVEARFRGRGLAGKAIARELQQRGSDAEIAAEAVAPVDASAEYARAVALVEKAWRVADRREPAQRDRRLMGMLARRGYSPQIAYQALREVSAKRQEELSDELDAGRSNGIPNETPDFFGDD